MKWLPISPLLVLALAAAPAWAQRAAGGHVSAGSSARGQGFNSGSNSGAGCRNGSCGNRRRNWQNGYYPYYGYPYWGVDSYWDMPDTEQAPPPTTQQAPYMIVMQSPQPQVPAAPPQSPKLVEIPQERDAQSNMAPVSAIFILSNGDRLESLRYFLTVNSLSIQQGQQERTFPLSALNVDATIAANRERGIDLNIPRDRTQISLGF